MHGYIGVYPPVIFFRFVSLSCIAGRGFVALHPLCPLGIVVLFYRRWGLLRGAGYGCSRSTSNRDVPCGFGLSVCGEGFACRWPWAECGWRTGCLGWGCCKRDKVSTSAGRLPCVYRSPLYSFEFLQLIQHVVQGGEPVRRYLIPRCAAPSPSTFQRFMFCELTQSASVCAYPSPLFRLPEYQHRT